MAFNNKYHLTLEQELPDKFATVIQPFWRKHAEINHFSGVDGVSISYASLCQGHPKALVLVPGRIESYLKYQELAFDLSQQGYDIFIIDHRGQGYSGRMTQDPQHGFVDSFDDYVNDFALWLDLLPLEQYTQRHLIAHSMGATIASLYLTLHHDRFDKAALCSPMFDINLGPFRPQMALSITAASIKSRTMMGWSTQYAPGQGPYQNRPFANNDLSQSESRYHFFRQLYESHPEIKVGGATHQWVNQAIQAADRAITQASQIRTPLLVLQAAKDRVVNAPGQDQFCRNLLQAGNPCFDEEPIVIGHAQHELLNERDKYRVPSLNYILDFFQ
ncbi:alpha/beta fold hydrolase [Motilimonas pumila]|uniref:Alpha/beta fold hydrolase n=1 Tax=Motilimonas pumila TaxID=2303987 RepID=A0A418YHY7_9GAMM|nr:alpha/beta fold hydrolase [Motilimonas pumila]RJG49944.1 alpha/beta fold hydrolase [Motilimonas pumila]